MVNSTWAPKGQTPCIWEQCAYRHLSLIATISENGTLIYQCHDSSIDSEKVAAFLKELCWYYRKHNISLIWDGAKIHAGEPVKQFLTDNPGRIQLHRLPAYSPELNACELLWAYLKQRLANRVFLNIDELKKAVIYELERIKKNKKLVRSFFQHKEVAFFLS